MLASCKKGPSRKHSLTLISYKINNYYHYLITIEVIVFLLVFFLTTTLFVGCNRAERDKEKVDEFQIIFVEGNYRKVLSDYDNVLAELADTSAIRRANEVYLKSQHIVNEVDSLINLADNFNNVGFNRRAIKYVEQAIAIYPLDSLSDKMVLEIPKDKTPKYQVGGTYGSVKFNYIFHTVYNHYEIRPVSVDIKVTNLSSYEATALGRFVPSFYYIDPSDMMSTGPRYLILMPKMNQWANDKKFYTPIFMDRYITGRINFSYMDVLRENTNVTLEKIFREIILGNDKRFFLSFAGPSKPMRGLTFIGYE